MPWQSGKISLVLMGIVLVLIVVGYSMVGGDIPGTPSLESIKRDKTLVPVAVDFSSATKSANPNETNLQMKTFTGKPLTPSCSPDKGVDVMLTIDYSGSMQGEKLDDAKKASANLAAILATNPNNRMGVNSFNEEATLYIGVTNDLAKVKTTIETLPSGSGRTCIMCGIDMAKDEIAKAATSNAANSSNKKIDILLTDGKANKPDPEDGAAQKALDAAKAAYAANTISFQTVGFGEGGSFSVNEALLKQIASDTKGAYYYASSSRALKAIFEQIAKTVCE